MIAIPLKNTQPLNKNKNEMPNGFGILLIS
jgi:hypothetical protein